VFLLGSDNARHFFTALSYVSVMPMGQHLPGIQRCDFCCSRAFLVAFNRGGYFLRLLSTFIDLRFCGVGGSQTVGVHRLDCQFELDAALTVCQRGQ
jgi:hypothetical protein